jgi:hypothetical protein
VIAQSDVTAWSVIAPWATPDQVEHCVDHARTTYGGIGSLPLLLTDVPRPRPAPRLDDRPIGSAAFDPQGASSRVRLQA